MEPGDGPKPIWGEADRTNECDTGRKSSILVLLVAGRQDTFRAELLERLRQGKINYDLQGVQPAERRDSELKRRATSGRTEQVDTILEPRTSSHQVDVARAAASAIRDPPVIGNTRFHSCARATPALDSYLAERHDERAEETAIQIARGWDQGHGAAVHVSKAKLARLAGLPARPGRALMSQLPDQTRSNEVKGLEDRDTIRRQANEWKLEPPRRTRRRALRCIRNDRTQGTSVSHRLKAMSVYRIS